MRISDWSSDVCSSDLSVRGRLKHIRRICLPAAGCRCGALTAQFRKGFGYHPGQAPDQNAGWDKWNPSALRTAIVCLATAAHMRCPPRDGKSAVAGKGLAECGGLGGAARVKTKRPKTHTGY